MRINRESRLKPVKLTFQLRGKGVLKAFSTEMMSVKSKPAILDLKTPDAERRQIKFFFNSLLDGFGGYFLSLLGFLWAHFGGMESKTPGTTAGSSFLGKRSFSLSEPSWNIWWGACSCPTKHEARCLFLLPLFHLR